MCAELASLNPCAVPFLSRAGVSLSWYYYAFTYDILYELRECSTVFSWNGYIFGCKQENNTALISYQLKLIKMRPELASLHYCAVPFFKRRRRQLVLVLF